MSREKFQIQLVGKTDQLIFKKISPPQNQKSQNSHKPRIHPISQNPTFSQKTFDNMIIPLYNNITR